MFHPTGRSRTAGVSLQIMEQQLRNILVQAHYPCIKKGPTISMATEALDRVVAMAPEVLNEVDVTQGNRGTVAETNHVYRLVF